MKSHRVMTRACPVPFCGNAARHGHLMCRSCWGNVPAATQQAVNGAWRAVRHALQQRQRPAELRPLVKAYGLAKDLAIAAAERSRP